MQDLGKLKKRTGLKCGDCGHPLELRVYEERREMLVCRRCGSEIPVVSKRVRRPREEEEDG